MTLRTAGLLLIHQRQLLLAFSKNKQCFFLPGGKINEKEGPEEALCREIAEELDINLHPEQLRFYTHISAPAFGEASGVMMEQDCYLVSTDELPRASAEIGELRYFSLHEYLLEKHQATGAIMILDQLTRDNLID